MKAIIKYVVTIIVVLVVASLSQQPFFRGIGKNVYNQAESQIESWMSGAQNWFMVNIYPKVSSEAQKRGEALQNEANKQKQKVTESIAEKIKNYFSGIVDRMLGKNNSSKDCNPQCPQTKP